MINFEVGKKLPDDFVEAVADGMSAIFSDRIIFILKLEDLEDENIKAFNNSKISIDLLELDIYKNEAGNLYAFSVKVDEFIDNSEVMVDFRVEDIEETMPTSFKEGNGIKSIFALVNEEGNILALREFKLGTKLSNIISDKAYGQNQIKIPENEKHTDYVMLTFQQLFRNEPEENLKLYSIGKTVVG